MPAKSKDYQRGYAITSAIGKLRFLPATNNYDALVGFPYECFAEYSPDGERMYERGEVVRVGEWKYLIQSDGRIDPSNPPRVEGSQVQPSLCKLFRDARRYPWVREEYCLEGFERYYDDGDPGRTGWYKVISERVDGSTPPPNDYLNWVKVES